ncbi:TrbI/VirB10 family protein [Nitrosomonas sp. Is37]|uniref:TrbI/VirB10 family protein n=1 Tax=Nitrosomonas sp. Is37 TaxID=3080535 RepID=UPI00294B1FC3|nr:TrbI/VirB10 family protein [Nitrosomonas sp. Is37]MDV6344792.1 TrbI/VirB10 family protein [Nitrosomonas sp. Is37]
MGAFTNPEMMPDASPNTVGVRRVNNLPIYIVVGIMIVFLIMMIVAVINRANQQAEVETKDDRSKAQSNDSFVNMLTHNIRDGIIPPEIPPSGVAVLEQPVIEIVRPERVDNLDSPPLPPRSGDYAEPGRMHSDDLERIRMVKQQQFMEAVKAGTTVNNVAPRSAGSPMINMPMREDTLARIALARQRANAEISNDPSTAYLERLKQLERSGIVGGGNPSHDEITTDVLGGSSGNTPDIRNDYARFDAVDQVDRWQLNSKLESPSSPFVIQTGSVIPALLISGINSDLPGQIMAQVSQDVYDTPIGKWKLIPQGAKLVGSYSSDVIYGQARILVAWQRIIFPDGRALDIGAMPGADGAGYAGFNDKVNNHYLRLFGSSVLLSAIVAGISLSQRDAGGAFGRQSASSIMSQSIGIQLGQTIAQLIRKNLNTSPTLEIRPGYRFNVIATKDMTFTKPYEAFNY